MMKIMFIGQVGTDAGGWYIGSDGKIHRIPGWNPEGMADVAHALNVLRAAAQIKTPGVAEAAIKSVLEFAHKELGAHAKEAVIVVG
jgi:hypothetical protein